MIEYRKGVNPHVVHADTEYYDSGKWKCPNSPTGSHKWKVSSDGKSQKCLVCNIEVTLARIGEEVYLIKRAHAVKKL